MSPVVHSSGPVQRIVTARSECPGPVFCTHLTENARFDRINTRPRGCTSVHACVFFTRVRASLQCGPAVIVVSRTIDMRVTRTCV